MLAKNLDPIQEQKKEIALAIESAQQTFKSISIE